jgi:hypothetical protein
VNFDETRIAADGLFYCVPWMRQAKERLIHRESLIEQLEAQRNIAGNEGMRLAAKVAQLEAALRDVNMICAQAPPIEDMEDIDADYGRVLTSIQQRVRNAFTQASDGGEHGLVK